MGKPAKSAKSGKSGGKSGCKSGKSRRTRLFDIDADYYARCITDYAWCAKLSYDKLSTMSEADLVKLNCGVAIDFKCDQGMKDHWKGWCQNKVTPVGDKYKVRDCIKAKVVLGVFQGCPKPDEKAGKGGKKRAANLSGDASSSMAIWASVGVVIFLLICALIAWWYLKGDKKGAGRTAKGASKSGKSKMTTGKSKLGSRKSLAGKSRAGSQRSKVSQASKGSAKKSRRSGTKKK